MITDEQCGMLAIWYCASEYHGASRKGDLIHFQNIAVVERATYALAEVGFLTLASDVPRNWALSVDAADMPNFAASELRPSEDRKERMLVQLIDLAANHLGLPVTRKVFEPKQNCFELMKVLAQVGFAEQIGESFQWTDRIGDIMRATYYWDDAGVSVDDQEPEPGEASATGGGTLADIIRELREGSDGGTSG